MSVILYFVVRRVLPPEIEEISGGKQAMAESYRALGSMTAPEKRLLAISLVLLGLWATENKLHSLDTASSTIAGVALMLLPGIGVMTWKQTQKLIPWGTVIVFAVGISLGTGCSIPRRHSGFPVPWCRLSSLIRCRPLPFSPCCRLS
ncbi:SLC13 family permease [Azorhizophilus paspali]|uniref:SLC13 family permease n=1 Tax=Azorhizophilus paspali TaxID=69963 RepID=A0ABV6SFH4_AZOPA